MTTLEGEPHIITYVDTVTREHRATVDHKGNVVTYGEPTVLSTDTARIICSECGDLSAANAMVHGISEHYEVLHI